MDLKQLLSKQSSAWQRIVSGIPLVAFGLRCRCVHIIYPEVRMSGASHMCMGLSSDARYGRRVISMHFAWPSAGLALVYLH